MMVAEDIRSPRSITTGVCTSSWYISQLTLEITIMLWKFTDLVAVYRVNTSIIVTPLSHQCLSNSLREGNGTHIIPSRHFVVWLLDQWISADPDHVLLSTPDYMTSKCWDLDSGLWSLWKKCRYCFSWFKVCDDCLKFSLEYSQRLHRPWLFTGPCHAPKALFMLSAASGIVCCFHLLLVPSACAMRPRLELIIAYQLLCFRTIYFTYHMQTIIGTATFLLSWSLHKVLTLIVVPDRKSVV